MRTTGHVRHFLGALTAAGLATACTVDTQSTGDGDLVMSVGDNTGRYRLQADFVLFRNDGVGSERRESVAFDAAEPTETTITGLTLDVEWTIRMAPSWQLYRRDNLGDFKQLDKEALNITLNNALQEFTITSGAAARMAFEFDIDGEDIVIELPPTEGDLGIDIEVDSEGEIAYRVAELAADPDAEFTRVILEATNATQIPVGDAEPEPAPTASGEVLFVKTGDQLQVVADVNSGVANTVHKWHLHSGTSCVNYGQAALGHLKDQDDPSKEPVLPTLQTNSAGNAYILDEAVGGPYVPTLSAISGRTVIVHLPSDGAVRIACGVIP